MPLRNEYGGSGGVMLNPNETEEEKIKRYQAELLRENATGEQVKSQQREYDRLSTTRAGPKGRTVGSRNTFVAASPWEHLAHVGAAAIRGKRAKKSKTALEETLGKQRAGKALTEATDRVRKERIDAIRAEQQEQLGEHYKNMDENAKARLANDELKINETARNNIRKHEEALSKAEAKATDFRPTTQGERKDVSAMRFGIDSVAEAGKTFQDSYARPLGGMPIISSMAVRLGTTAGVDPTAISDMSNLFGSKTEQEKTGEASNFQDAARWLAGWKQGYTLWARNELFGATLTPSEQTAWNEAGEINLNMEAGEIRRRVTQAEAIMRKRADSKAFTSITAGQNPELFTGMTSTGFDPNTYGQNMAAPTGAVPGTPATPGTPPAGAAPGQQPQRVISYKDVGKY